MTGGVTAKRTISPFLDVLSTALHPQISQPIAVLRLKYSKVNENAELLDV